MYKVRKLDQQVSGRASELRVLLVLLASSKHCPNSNPVADIDIEYNKRLDRQRPCLEDELNGGSNNIVQSNKSV